MRRSCAMVPPPSPSSPRWSRHNTFVRVARGDILEWRPVYVLGSDTFIRWSLTFALGMLAVVLLGRADRRPQQIVALLVLAAASFMVTRLQAFFALGVLFLVGAGIGR